MNFLKEAYNKGVRNIEMESLCFAAMCHHAGIKSKLAYIILLQSNFQANPIKTFIWTIYICRPDIIINCDPLSKKQPYARGE